MSELEQHEEMLTAAQAGAAAASARLAWLRDADAVLVHKPRTAMASTPTWFFAGDLLAVAASIEELVSRTVPVGRGAKDDLPLVYLSNPPRHGKSLCCSTGFFPTRRQRALRF
jgi:hypothetical protein